MGSISKNFVLVSLLMVVHSAAFSSDISVVWLGQTDDDFVGQHNVPNGVNDWVIEIEDDRLISNPPASWNVSGGYLPGGVAGYWHAPEDGVHWPLYVELFHRKARLYFEPIWSRPGEVFRVNAVYSEDEQLTYYAVSTGVTWCSVGQFFGQSSHDYVGDHHEPNGINDWLIDLQADELMNTSVMRWEITLPSVATWLSGDDQFRPIHAVRRRNRYQLYFDPVLAVAGLPFWVRGVLEDGQCLHWIIPGDGSVWNPHGTWFGQSGPDFVGPELEEPNGIKDWHLQVMDEDGQNINAKMWVVRGPEDMLWSYPQQDGMRPLAVRAVGQKANLYLEPYSDRAGGVFYVTAIDNSGYAQNWGIVAARSVFSTDASWGGQGTVDLVDGAVENDGAAPPWFGVADWEIRLTHPLLDAQAPVAWSVEGAGHLWVDTLREQDLSLMHPYGHKTNADCDPWELVVEPIVGGGVLLRLEPVVCKPGEQFVVTALFADGNLINWGLSSPPKPVASQAQWVSSQPRRQASTQVGVSVSSDNDDTNRDWCLEVSSEQLRGRIPERWLVSQGDRQWDSASVSSQSMLLVQRSRVAGTWRLCFESFPCPPETVFTVQALMSDGALVFWYVVANDQGAQIH